MSNLSVGNIAVEAHRAVRLNSQKYGDHVLNLIDELVSMRRLYPGAAPLSNGGVKEMLRTREIIADFFYNGRSENLQPALDNLMGFAFMERNVQ
jgi:hypothetical protein